MVPDIEIMMGYIIEVIITDMMIQDVAENHQVMVIVQIDVTVQGVVS